MCLASHMWVKLSSCWSELDMFAPRDYCGFICSCRDAPNTPIIPALTDKLYIFSCLFSSVLTHVLHTQSDTAAFYITHFLLWIMIALGSLVRWVGLLSHLDRTAPPRSDDLRVVLVRLPCSDVPKRTELRDSETNTPNDLQVWKHSEPISSFKTGHLYLKLKVSNNRAVYKEMILSVQDLPSTIQPKGRQVRVCDAVTPPEHMSVCVCVCVCVCVTARPEDLFTPRTMWQCDANRTSQHIVSEKCSKANPSRPNLWSFLFFFCSDYVRNLSALHKISSDVKKHHFVNGWIFECIFCLYLCWVWIGL